MSSLTPPPAKPTLGRFLLCASEPCAYGLSVPSQCHYQPRVAGSVLSAAIKRTRECLPLAKKSGRSACASRITERDGKQDSVPGPSIPLVQGMGALPVDTAPAGSSATRITGSPLAALIIYAAPVALCLGLLAYLLIGGLL